MEVRKELQDLEDKVIKGLEKSHKAMLQFKKQMNSPLIVSKEGKVVEIKAESILNTET
ncbi:MAG: hypothetical protein OEW75_13270 [Cyclobacteriaceae bacterium]|nr:hypothetical protein [Cyclobacteriaceae bacterium]